MGFGVNKLQKRMLIRGRKPLNGSIPVQGAKNATLPIMAASILLKNKSLTLENVPNLNDVQTMSELLRQLGAEVTLDNGHMVISVPVQLNWDTPAELVRKMRASSLVLGPLLARFKQAVLPLPGGCAIGSRPIDFHLKALTKMGAQIDLKHGAVYAKAENGLKGTNIMFDFPSVGATENIMMAATVADGVTVIENAAREPEIVNLADVLRYMGAEVSGDGTSTITITGKKFLHSARAAVIPDRIEAVTYLIAGLITKGTITVSGIGRDLLEPTLTKLEEAGAEFICNQDSVEGMLNGNCKAVSLRTMPHPGFPTDAQPQMMALLALADGTSVIHESVFDSRLVHINEFKKMGAKIELQDNTAIITGVKKLHGAEVCATDLRAGAAMIILGLAAEGETIVGNLEHVWRGYENIVGKLRSAGADIELID